MRVAKGVVGSLTAALVLLSVGPLVLPFQVFSALDGSMAPALPAGSLVVATRVPATQLRVGDVITFQPPGETGFITRRVYSLRPSPSGPVVQTRADANPAADPWRLSLQGSGWRKTRSVPFLGYLLAPATAPYGKLILLLVLGMALTGLFLLERRPRLRRGPGRRLFNAPSRSLLVVGGLLVLTAPATLAALFAQTTNASGSFTNVALVSPAAPAGTYTPSTVVLTWTAASPMNGNGYAISGVNNGASNVCPAAAGSYSTYVGSTAAVTLTDLGAIAQGAPGTYACYLIQTGYNPAGAPPWAAVPQWTSLTALATVAVRLGVQSVQVGPLSAVQVTTVTGTLPAASTAGNLLVATLRVQATATQSVAPAGWVFAAGVSNASAQRTEIFYYPNAPATTTAAFTLPAGNAGEVQLSEWKNVSKVTPLDRTGTFSTVAANVNGTVSTAGATTLANELVIVNAGFGFGATTITPAAGWTSLAQNLGVLFDAEYRFNLPAAVASETVTANPAVTWSMAIATFK